MPPETHTRVTQRGNRTSRSEAPPTKRVFFAPTSRYRIILHNRGGTGCITPRQYSDANTLEEAFEERERLNNMTNCLVASIFNDQGLCIG